MRSIIRLLDRFLRRAQGVFEYWNDPACLFRASFGHAPRQISLPDGEIPEGAKVLLLHFWNEHMPRIPPEGPNINLAMRGARMLKASFRALAREVQRNPALADAKAVGGAGVLIYPDAGPGAEKLLRRLGFSIFPYHHPLGGFGEFWENLFTWGLIWTFNEVSLRQRHLLRLDRSELWMSTDTLLRLHGDGRAPVQREAQPPNTAPATE
jgi:hypothetical protein